MGDRIRLFKEVYPDRKQLEADAKKKHKEEIEWQKQKEYTKKLLKQRTKRGSTERRSLDEIQDRFLRGENISALIQETLLTNGFLPASPITLLQNTNPPTVCYMNSVLQCVAHLPGFVGCENWPLKVIDEGNPQDAKEAATVDAFFELIEAMRLPLTGEQAQQRALIAKQANFYTRMYEVTVRNVLGDIFYPLDQSDADSFRVTLFNLLVRQVTAPIKSVRTLDEPIGHSMLAPLYGYCRLNNEIHEVRTLDTLIEVAVPPISRDKQDGFNQWIHDPAELKEFRVIPDTIVLKAALFGFDGKHQDTIPIVPIFDIANYQVAGWQPKNAGSTRYRLYGIVCHHGETIDAGHYTALCFHNGEWWHIDDIPPSAVRIELPANLPSTDYEHLKFANPYIFFYVREGTGPYEINADDSFVMRPLPVPVAAPAGSGLSAEELAAYPRFATAAARLAELKAPQKKRNRVTRKKQRSTH
jgi:hypothetical protein